MGHFAFDNARHEYIDLDTGTILPHITGMIEAAGIVDDRWYTEESCDRGSEVHRITAQYDLGAIPRAQLAISAYKAWLDSYLAALAALKPEWTHVEEALIHEGFRYGGRPDRGGTLEGVAPGVKSVLDIKSGVEDARAHGVQTALQAILIAPEWDNLPPESIVRHCLYLNTDKKGKWRLRTYDSAADFREARRLIREYC